MEKLADGGGDRVIFGIRQTSRFRQLRHCDLKSVQLPGVNYCGIHYHKMFGSNIHMDPHVAGCIYWRKDCELFELYTTSLWNPCTKITDWEVILGKCREMIPVFLATCWGIHSWGDEAKQTFLTCYSHAPNRRLKREIKSSWSKQKDLQNLCKSNYISMQQLS